MRAYFLVFIIGFLAFAPSDGTAAPRRTEPQPTSSKLRIADSTFLQRLTLNDGSVVIGRIASMDSTTLNFQMRDGSMNIQRDAVKAYEELAPERVRDGQFWFTNPNRTRLFFAPTARMLPKNKGYFADYYLFFTVAGWGVSDNVSFGGGMSLIPGVSIAQQVKYIIPKVGFSPDSNVFLAVGALIASIPDGFDEGDSRTTAGFLYGISTFGTDDNSLTAGIGYGFVDGEWAENPAFVIGGEARMSRRASFVSENWFVGGEAEIMFSGGIRFFGESIAVDLAFWYPTSAEDLKFPIPYVDFVYNF
jgi:hypothetical protein